jgi:catechol 2,3-dioxygenase-like lactoylglutathione lyase family enzyme
MDYSPHVTGSPRIADYTHDAKAFDGFVFPTRRRVHLYDEDGRADQSFAPITLDVADVTVERARRPQARGRSAPSSTEPRDEQLPRPGSRPGTSTGATDPVRREAVATPTRRPQEVIMSTTQLNTIPSPPEGQDLATVPMKFEVTPIPVTDFDRAKAFYQRLGWRLDIDLQFTEEVRAVQFTPPGSPASIQFGPAGADRLQRLLLIVEDIEAARAELVGRGVEVSEVFHAAPGQAPQPGRDPEGRSYLSQAAFSDPDGNQWVLQEVTERIAGRV